MKTIKMRQWEPFNAPKCKCGNQLSSQTVKRNGAQCGDCEIEGFDNGLRGKVLTRVLCIARFMNTVTGGTRDVEIEGVQDLLLATDAAINMCLSNEYVCRLSFTEAK